MQKLSNYIFNFFKEKGIDTVFLISGGGAMHLNDSVCRIEGIKYVCSHHEQASAMAAESYARVSNKPAIVNVTTGPGGINALNGVFGAFTDSIPMIVISGQVKRETLMQTYQIDGLRQLGDQEVDIISMVKKITKYSFCVIDPESIKFHLQKAFFYATKGRPGPVWLDIPVDVQSSMIDENNLKQYEYESHFLPNNTNLKNDVKKVVEKLNNATRPVIIGSTGIRLSNAMDTLEHLLEIIKIPVVSAWCHDFINHFHECYVGKQGSIGDRAGNFVTQNSDLVIIIGSRMPIRQVSYNWENFAREAYKIQVDIDAIEMKKPTIKIDLPLNYDAKEFLEELIIQIKQLKFPVQKFQDWLNWGKQRQIKFPVLLDKHQDKTKPLNPYYFIHYLQKKLNAKDIIVCANATATIVTFQTFQIPKGQMLISNSGSASMGYDLPAAIGAAIAEPTKRIICIAGDGSIQMNIQELQTIVQNKMNIKIIVLNNNGYLSIKQTQNNFFKLSVGSHPESGVSFPSMEKIGFAYGIPSFIIKDFDFQEKLQEYLTIEGPVLIEVILDQDQSFEPKLSSKQLPNGKMVSAPLEDMFPFLDEETLKQNMIIPIKQF